jgi:hypothetical protein
MARPVGPVKIVKTDLKADDVMVAKLSGAVNACVAVVRHKGDHYFVAPKELGGIKKVPADSLTDGLHASVRELNVSQAAKSRRKK